MTRRLQKLVQDLHQKAVKSSKCNKCNIQFLLRASLRYFSQKNKDPVKLAYKLFEPKGGSGDQPPLLFLHGVASSKEASWGNFPQVIADQTKRKAYSLDARNHGDSEWSDEFSFDLTVVDLLHFIEEHKFPKVVLIGHSMGGITCIKAALKAPEKVEIIFGEETYVKKVPQVLLDKLVVTFDIWKEAEKLIPPGLSKNEADCFITKYTLSKMSPQSKFKSNPDPRMNYSYPLRRDSRGSYFLNINMEVLREKYKNGDSLMEEVEGIYEGPSYFLYATKSPFQVGNEKSHILRHFPKTVFIPFEGSQHFLHRQFPDQFIETIVKYINLNDRRRLSSR